LVDYEWVIADCNPTTPNALNGVVENGLVAVVYIRSIIPGHTCHHQSSLLYSNTIIENPTRGGWV